MAARPDALFQQLEPRVLLAGDDHADAFDYLNATELVWDDEDSDIFGSIFSITEGTIEEPGDTDFFRFISPATTGEAIIAVFDDMAQNAIAPAFDIHVRNADDGSWTMIATIEHTDEGSMLLLMNPGQPFLFEGHEYFLTARASTYVPDGRSTTGDYLVFAFLWFGDHAGAPQSYTDDHPNWGGPDDPTPITLSSADGVGRHTGLIETVGDTDVFRFRSPYTGTATIAVDRGATTLAPMLRVNDIEQATIRTGITLVPGEQTTFTFDVIAGNEYDLIVASGNAREGGYSVDIRTTPIAYKLFYPEGYSAPTIAEFIPMVNPNEFAVDYTVIARYEWGDRDQIIARGTLEPESRGGITVNVRDDESASLTRTGVPYTLEIQTTAPIGATLSHYDFGVTTGESFTNDTSTTWTFAEAHRHADFRDYVVFHNPHNREIDVSIQLLFEDGQVVELARTLSAHRRGGISLHDDPGFDRDGVFGIRITADDPIIAALTSYNIADQVGFGLLGLPADGATSGVIPNVSIADTELAVLNLGTTNARVTLYISYAGAFADKQKTIVIPPRTTTRIIPAELNLTVGHGVSIRYESDAPVTLTAVRVGDGDADALTASMYAANRFLFGDAFFNTDLAGSWYFETLSVFNAGDADTSVTIEFLFFDSPSVELVFAAPIGEPLLLNLHQLRQLTDRPGLLPFSVVVTADQPVVASMTHYDLFLGGGWATLGTPIGGLFAVSPG